MIMQFIIMTGVILALSTSYYVYFKKHFKPAGYYNIAWTILFIGAVFFKEIPDLPAIIGLSLIIIGVVVINVFSKTAAH